jgi:hypothetical protein
MVEEALKALSSADAPPTRDYLFEITVMVRIESRRFYWALARSVGLTLAATAILVLVAPRFERLWPAELPLGRSCKQPGAGASTAFACEC